MKKGAEIGSDEAKKASPVGCVLRDNRNRILFKMASLSIDGPDD